jgi:hypothetical protein
MKIPMAILGKVIMETCKNKVTGATFIVVEELGNEKAVMITPDGRVKPLEMKFFNQFQTGQDEKELLDRGEITGQQFRSFNMYFES